MSVEVRGPSGVQVQIGPEVGGRSDCNQIIFKVHKLRMGGDGAWLPVGGLRGPLFCDLSPGGTDDDRGCS